MELHTLKPAAGAIKKRKRIGRGEGSKKGGTSTKGHKGQQSRAGYSAKVAFEGGQTPLTRRLPKFGGLKPKGNRPTPINLEKIAEFAIKYSAELIDLAFLRKTRLLNKKGQTCKIVGTATLPKKLEIHAHSFSQSAKEDIERQGSTTQTL